MLVLSRRTDEKIVIPSLGIEITVVDFTRERVRLGITAPREIEVHRKEVWEAIQRNGYRMERSKIQQNPDGQTEEV